MPPTRRYTIEIFAAADWTWAELEVVIAHNTRLIELPGSSALTAPDNGKDEPD